MLRARLPLPVLIHRYIQGEVRDIFLSSIVISDLSEYWQRSPLPTYTADDATYRQILTQLFDSPLALSPFSLHGMALSRSRLIARSPRQTDLFAMTSTRQISSSPHPHEILKWRGRVLVCVLLGNTNPIYHDAITMCVVYSTPSCGFN